MRRKEWMRVVAALAAFAVLGTGSAVTAAAEETGTVVSETDSTADKTVFTGSGGEDATWTYDKSSETLTIMGTGSVEAYVKAGVMIKTPGWQVVNDYAAKHIVIGDGITEVGEGFLDTCIYGTTDPRTLQVSSTVTKMDLNPALQERSVTFYGTKGSWFYEQVYETNRFVDISTGEPDKVPTSGTYSDGASWNYDEKSETLTVSGDGGITEKEFTTYFGWDRPVKRIVIGKEVKLPDWNSDVSGLNLFFRALISDAETGNGPFLSIYPDSEAGKAYEDLVAYRVSKGSTEEEVRSGLEEVVAFLDADIAYTGACGAEGSEITWSLDPNTNTLTFSGTGTTAAQFAGVAAAEIKSAMTYLDPSNGQFAPGEAVGVFQRGSINVKCYGTTAPELGGAVYVLLNTTETAGLTNVPVGSFTAMEDGTTSANTVQLTNCQWGGPADANGVAELVILTKANA